MTIDHIATLHRLHRRRHKRYRESPLAEAVDELIREHKEQDMPVSNDYHADDDQPVYIDKDGKEYHDIQPVGCVGLIATFIVLAFFYCMFNAYVMPVEQQELQPADVERTAPIEQMTHLQEGE